MDKEELNYKPEVSEEMINEGFDDALELFNRFFVGKNKYKFHITPQAVLCRIIHKHPILMRAFDNLYELPLRKLFEEHKEMHSNITRITKIRRLKLLIEVTMHT